MRDRKNSFFKEDTLNVGRGIVFGILFGVLLWVVVIFGIVVLLRIFA